MSKKWEILPPGIHSMPVSGFIEKYCESDEFGSAREAFIEPLEEICAWAKDAGATRIIVGGSFLSEKNSPSDIDLLVLFRRSGDVRKCQESLLLREMTFDIQFLAEDQQSILDAFMYLLSTGKAGDKRGVVQIELGSNRIDLEIPSVAPIFYKDVLEIYGGRLLQTPIHQFKGIIVPIHGVNTSAQWLPYLSLVAGSSGWGVAPFVYGKESVTTILRRGRRNDLVQGLRSWINEVRGFHKGPIGIFAHSLGTYLFAQYLTRLGDSSEGFCGVVLAGSILSKNFDWTKYLDKGVVSAVLNTVSTADRLVGLMPEGGFPPFRDPLYGRAGVVGFSTAHVHLKEVRMELLDHNNMFERDVIHASWMPFFALSLRHYKGPLR